MLAAARCWLANASSCLQSNSGANFHSTSPWPTLGSELHGSTLRSAYARFKIHLQAGITGTLLNSLALAANNIPNAATAQAICNWTATTPASSPLAAATTRTKYCCRANIRSARPMATPI